MAYSKGACVQRYASRQKQTRQYLNDRKYRARPLHAVARNHHRDRALAAARAALDAKRDEAVHNQVRQHVDEVGARQARRRRQRRDFRAQPLADELQHALALGHLAHHARQQHVVGLVVDAQQRLAQRRVRAGVLDVHEARRLLHRVRVHRARVWVAVWGVI